MKTENILLILAIIIIILFLINISRHFLVPSPIIVQNPPVLTQPIINRVYGRSPKPCPFPFGCGGKNRPGRGGWFPKKFPKKGNKGKNKGKKKI